MSKLIAAFTAHNNVYPAFINIQKTEKKPYCNGKVKITVREQGHPERCGPIAEIIMSQSDFAKLLEEATENFTLDLHDPNQSNLNF